MDLKEFLEIVLGLCGIIGSLGVYFINAGRQYSTNEQNEKRFLKIESDIKEIDNLISIEFKEIQKTGLETQKSVDSLAHKFELALFAVNSRFDKDGDIRKDFNKIFGIDPLDKLRHDQK